MRLGKGCRRGGVVRAIEFETVDIPGTIGRLTVQRIYLVSAEDWEVAKSIAKIESGKGRFMTSDIPAEPECRWRTAGL
jgi:hypothetical protein